MKFSEEFPQGTERGATGAAGAFGAGSSSNHTSSGTGSSRNHTASDAADAGTSSSWSASAGAEAPDWTEVPFSGAFAGQMWQGTEDLAPAGPWGLVELSPMSALGSLTDAVESLERLNELQCWAAAQKARLVERIRELYGTSLRPANGDPASAQAHADQDEYVLSLAAEEIGPLLRLPARSAKELVELSRLLVSDHERTLTSMQAGKLSWRHATTIVEECVGVPADSVVQFEKDLIETAEQATVAKLTRYARGLREILHPKAAPVRKARAVAERRVVLEPCSDGMAWLSAYLPAEQACGIYNRLDAGARGLQAPDEDRTLTQLRADVFADLLTHTCPGNTEDGSGFRGIGATVHITVPALTLLDQMQEVVRKGLDENAAVPERNSGSLSSDIRADADSKHFTDRPGYAVLEGYGPIDADTAARLAGHAPSFARILTHPETGAALSIGRVAYRPPKHLQDWVRIRDKTCRHPGCNRVATLAEIDHTVPWVEGGRTDHSNLSCLCAKHHMLKTKGHWGYAQPEPGVITAMAPSGKTYTTQPPPF